MSWPNLQFGYRMILQSVCLPNKWIALSQLEWFWKWILFFLEWCYTQAEQQHLVLWVPAQIDSKTKNDPSIYSIACSISKRVPSSSVWVNNLKTKIDRFIAFSLLLRNYCYCCFKLSRLCIKNVNDSLVQ